MIKIDGLKVKMKSYPNGETIVKETVSQRFAQEMVNVRYAVTFKYQEDGDLIKLLLAKRTLDLQYPDGISTLRIRYMPYSRMDRAGDSGVCTLEFITDFINSLGFRTVIVEEPHSAVTCALIKHSFAEYPTMTLLPDVLKKIGFHDKLDYILLPDAGAQARYSNLTGFHTAVGFKHRDFETGELTGTMEVVGFNTSGGGSLYPKVLIIDDLCSRGGTFVMAAKHLRSLGATEVYLLVAHCEETMWYGELLEHIDGLYCTDSILDPVGVIMENPLEDKVHVYTNGEWK